MLFADFAKEIGGVIKILDGNTRAIPTTAMQVFIKFKLLSENEINKLSHWTIQRLTNHAKKNIGKIIAKLI